MIEEEVRQLLVNTGAIMEGHFLLTSGLHSPLYVEKFQVLQWPEPTAKLCEALADRFRNDGVQVVVGPVTGGIILSQLIGRCLGSRAIFTERDNGSMTLKRGFYIEPGEKVLVVEDIVTTGGSVEEVLEVVRKQGGEIVGVALLVDRSGGKVDFGVRTESLLKLSVPTYQPDSCPQCKGGVPISKRGRTGK